ncbi:hypothetical protein BS47DRAFT_1360434 [Hydnum rufescens UP504]|uniref:Uncharacterized protein n=1 Tax=Hydnum rufescens UP504 TaxID=1448309 RepID=A0A9P6B3E7_9AGAM|nr:hypothetical protein BS47DRAFT_1360434 [Hydnum rufescens UP504]
MYHPTLKKCPDEHLRFMLYFLNAEFLGTLAITTSVDLNSVGGMCLDADSLEVDGVNSLSALFVVALTLVPHWAVGVHHVQAIPGGKTNQGIAGYDQDCQWKERPERSADHLPPDRGSVERTRLAVDLHKWRTCATAFGAAVDSQRTRDGQFYLLIDREEWPTEPKARGVFQTTRAQRKQYCPRLKKWNLRLINLTTHNLLPHHHSELSWQEMCCRPLLFRSGQCGSSALRDVCLGLGLNGDLNSVFNTVDRWESNRQESCSQTDPKRGLLCIGYTTSRGVDSGVLKIVEQQLQFLGFPNIPNMGPCAPHNPGVAPKRTKWSFASLELWNPHLHSSAKYASILEPLIILISSPPQVMIRSLDVSTMC